MWVKARPRFLCLKQELYPDNDYFYVASDMGARHPRNSLCPRVPGNVSASLGDLTASVRRGSPLLKTQFPENVMLRPLPADFSES